MDFIFNFKKASDSRSLNKYILYYKYYILYIFRLLDIGKGIDLSGQRVSLNICGFELHMVRQTLNPAAYQRYMSLLLHNKITFYYQRFEFFQMIVQNGEILAHFIGKIYEPIYRHTI